MAAHHRKRNNQVKAHVPPARQAGQVSYPASFPSALPSLRRIQEALPFPVTLTDNLAWASAFIDHSGHLVKDLESKYAQLELRFHAAIDTLGANAIEIALLREKVASQDRKVEGLETEVSQQTRATRELEQRLAKARGDAAKKEHELTAKLSKSEKALHKAVKAEQRLKQKLDETLVEEHERWAAEMEHEHEDHLALDAAHTALEEVVQEKAALQQALDAAAAELSSVKAELETTTAQLTECSESGQAKTAEIASLNDQLAAASRNVTRLNTDLDHLQATADAQAQELSTARQSLADTSAELEETKQAVAAKEEIIHALEASVESLKQESENKSKVIDDMRVTSQEALAALQTKLDEITAHDAEDHQKLEAAEQAKKLADDAVSELQAQAEQARLHDEEDHRRLAAEEQAKRDVEAQLARTQANLDEALKPKLPNKVTLSNPIPIAGSLSGAPSDIDDTFWPLDSPFPITLFNHTSTAAFVSSNGVFSIGEGSSVYSYKPADAANTGLPTYALLPFWADLYIYKDTPQGIYYEAAGEAPGRTLTVEWYVSRYQNRDQYYHFNMTLEEARPNIVTYRYYEALDQGGACMIGAVGPSAPIQWSFNQPKALPGAQVEIDTAALTMQDSTFTVPS